MGCETLPREGGRQARQRIAAGQLGHTRLRREQLRVLAAEDRVLTSVGLALGGQKGGPGPTLASDTIEARHAHIRGSPVELAEAREVCARDPFEQRDPDGGKID